MVKIEARQIGDRLYTESRGRLFAMTIVDPQKRMVAVECSIPAIADGTKAILVGDVSIGGNCRLRFANGEYALTDITSVAVKGDGWEWECTC